MTDDTFRQVTEELERILGEIAGAAESRHQSSRRPTKGDFWKIDKLAAEGIALTQEVLAHLGVKK